MGFTEILTIVLVVLKASGDLNSWSWWLVFSPEIVAAAFYFVIAVLGITGVVTFVKGRG